jgi:hypothetical protein
MMRVLVVLGGALLAGAEACACGPATHLYVARQILGTDWPEALYGSMFPDVFGFAPTDAFKGQIQHLTHFEFDRVSPSPFAAGVATHNGTWGADYYSHAYYNPGEPDTYLTARMKQLSQEFGFSVGQGEDLVEGVLDYLVRRDQGPAFGLLMKASADGTGAAVVQQVVDVFALPLSQQVPGLTLEAAQANLRTMCQQHLTLIRVYGQQLAVQDTPYIRSVLVQGMASYLQVDEATADQYVTRTEEICWDYQDELDAMALRIAGELNATPYRLPLKNGIILVQGLAICGLFYRTRRRHRGAPPFRCGPGRAQGCC